MPGTVGTMSFAKKGMLCARYGHIFSQNASYARRSGSDWATTEAKWTDGVAQLVGSSSGVTGAGETGSSHASDRVSRPAWIQHRDEALSGACPSWAFPP